MTNQDDDCFSDFFSEYIPSANILSNSPRKDLSVMIFSWNTSGIRLADTLNEQEISFDNKEKYLPVLLDLQVPDFFPALEIKITKNNYDIVVIGFQEDVKPGSYFHSHFLPAAMERLNYTLYDTTRMIGMGIVTYKALFDGSVRFRGLRMSVYVRNTMTAYIQPLSVKNDCYVINPVTRSKGAIAIYLDLGLLGTYVFINEHLPFNSKSLTDCKLSDNYMLRQNSLAIQNLAFNNIYETLVLSYKKKIDHVFIFGDLNYRIKPTFDFQTVKFATAQEYYQTHDELVDQISKSNIYTLNEGINNQGPTFTPTAKLVKGRYAGENKFKLGKNNQRYPSWCDRILYKSANITCKSYDSFEEGRTMCMSDHSGIIGEYELEL